MEVTCGQAQKLLAAEGIPMLVLKGPHVAAVLYDDPAQRDYCDLDVLVRPENFVRAARALVAGGFCLNSPNPRRLASERADYQLQFRSPRGVLLELHRALADTSQFRSDVEGFFHRSEEFEFGELQARGLGTEDLLLHLCLHFGKRHFITSEKKHLRDIAHLVERRVVEWDVFLARVHASRCKIVTYFCLRAVQEQNETQVPAKVLESLRPGPCRRRPLKKYIDPCAFPLYKSVADFSGLRERIVNLLLLDRVSGMVFSSICFAQRAIMDKLLIWSPLRRIWINGHPLKNWLR